MRLSAFIRKNEEAILQEWEDFAVSIHSRPQAMDKDALRDHARLMLHVIADDLDMPQSSWQQSRKSRGLSPRGREETTAAAHGGDRMGWGFSIGDMVSEFRALRASVIRLWENASPHLRSSDLIRFNEAIDQALAESVESYVTGNQAQELLLNTMLSNSSDHSYIFDIDGRLRYVNRAMADVYRKHPSEMTGKLIDDFDRSLAAEVHRQTRHVIAARSECRGEVSIRSASGKEHVIEYLFAPILDDDGKIETIAGNSRDITDRKTWERTLWQHANHDHLTGIPNRRLFLDRLDQDIKHAKRSSRLLALLFIDLDKFKDANDRLGHDGGDQLLKLSVQRIASCVRETDTLARLGGDEFTVILTGPSDAEHVEALATKMLTQLRKPLLIERETVNIGGSIGIALFPDDGSTVDELIANADRAMYAAKNAGGNRLEFYYPAGRAERRADRSHASRPGGHSSH